MSTPRTKFQLRIPRNHRGTRLMTRPVLVHPKLSPPVFVYISFS